MESLAHKTFVIFNIAEGALWLAIAVGLLLVLYRKRRNPNLILPLAALFATFGLSDWVEIETGGWYKPWWMLAWKALNLAGLLVILVFSRSRVLSGQVK